MLPDIHRATQKFYIFLIVYLTGCTPPQARICHSVYRNFGVTSKNIYKSKNKIKIMPKNSSKYLDKLKECKNISHIFIDNLKGRIYNRK